MNEKIVEMVKLAIENGAVSQKHRNLILNKAKEVGEDPDLVEIYLDNELAKLSVSRTAVSQETKGVMKCPHCGAPITDTMLSCPECGFVFQKENQASKDAIAMIKDFQRRYEEACTPKKDSIKDNIIYGFFGVRRATAIIRSFTLPYTKEGLVQMLEYSYSNYVSTDDSSIFNGESIATMRQIKMAWYGKANQALSALSRFERDNPEIQSIVSKYKLLLANSKKFKLNTQWLYILGFFFLVGGVIPFFGIRMERNDAARTEMKACLKENNYAGARAAIKMHSGNVDEMLDDISVQEINYWLSNGKLQQAKTVVFSIKNQHVKDAMLKVITEAENSGL